MPVPAPGGGLSDFPANAFVPNTRMDLRLLTVAQVNSLLRRYGLPVRGGDRIAKINRLARHLGIREEVVV